MKVSELIEKLKGIYKRFNHCKGYIFHSNKFAEICIYNAHFKEGDTFRVEVSHPQICDYVVMNCVFESGSNVSLNKCRDTEGNQEFKIGGVTFGGTTKDD